MSKEYKEEDIDDILFGNINHDYGCDSGVSERLVNIHIKPLIETRYDAIVISCESSFICSDSNCKSNTLFKSFDTMAGIDYIIISKSNQTIKTMASRTQSDGIDWRTFTVRIARDNGTKTEVEKRTNSIFEDDTNIYPSLTMQAYFKGEELLSAAIVRTKALYEFVARKEYKINHTAKDRQGQCTFGSVAWSKFSEKDIIFLK